MQPLATTRRVMTWLCMYPVDETATTQPKMAYLVHTLVILLFHLVSFTASFAFIWKYVSIDFNGAIFAFMIGIGEVGLIYFLTVAILMCYQIESIYLSLSNIYKSNENEVAFGYLTIANKTSEWAWTLYARYVAVALGGVVNMSLTSVLYCYLTQGDFNTQLYYRPVNYVLPWNQSTNLGYFAELSTYISVSYGYYLLNGTPMLLFISLCIHHRAFYKMFKHKIDGAEKYDANLLCDLIRFHLSAKDLFLDSANFYRPFVLVQLICNTVWMTVSVFYFDLQSHDINFTMTSVMVAASIGISNLFIYCYFGKLATESYEMMSDCVYNMEWYEQPNELLKYFVVMIANMQKTLYYHGFGIAYLDLRTFIKLCNSICSYYMMIKAVATK